MRLDTITDKEKKLRKILDENLSYYGLDFQINATDNILQKGQLLHFNGDFYTRIIELPNTSEKYKFGFFKTKEGIDISFSQITRGNNGLNIPASLNSRKIWYFYSVLADDGIITLQVTDIKISSLSIGTFNSKRVYYFFRIYNDSPQKYFIEQENTVQRNLNFDLSGKIRLKNALNLIIKDKGIYFLENPTFQNLLSDIVDFSDEPASKIVIREYCINNDFRNLVKENTINSKKYYLDIMRRKAVRDYGFNENIVRYVIEAIAFGLEIEY